MTERDYESTFRCFRWLTLFGSGYAAGSNAAALWLAVLACLIILLAIAFAEGFSLGFRKARRKAADGAS